MQLFVDIDSRQAVSGLGSSAARAAIVCSSQDTLDLDVYFLRGGVIIDVGAGAALKFGLFASTALTTALALIPAVFPAYSGVTAYTAGQVVTQSGTNYVCILATTGNAPPNATYWLALPSLAWSRQGPDTNGNYFWRGLLYLNTSQMATAMSALSAGQTLPCQSEFRYQLSDGEIVHTIYLAFTIFPALLTEQSTYTITIPPPGYPDPSTIELLVHKGAASGYAELDSSTLLNPAEGPIDGTTIVIASSKWHVPIDEVTIKLVSGQLVSNFGGGLGGLGGVVKTTLTVAAGTTFKVYLTASPTFWAGGGDIATFVATDGITELGTNEVDSTGTDGGGFFLVVRINTNYANCVVVGDTLAAGVLVFWGIGLQTTQTSAGVSLVAQEAATPDNFYPSIKGLKSTDLSVKVLDATEDLDLHVSTPAFSGFIPTPAGQAYTVDLAAATTYNLVKIFLKVSTGTLTAALNRNGSAVTGAGSMAVTSTRSSVVLSQVVAVDDLIELVLSSLSGTPLNLAYSVRTQPT